MEFSRLLIQAFAGWYCCLFMVSCFPADDVHEPEKDRFGVVFYSDRTGGGDLYYFNLQDSTTQRLTTSDSSEYNPVWLADIGKVYHLRQENNIAQIISLDLENGESKLIGINPGFEERPDWRPDGSQCIFNTKDSTGSALIIGDASAKAVKTVLRDSFFNKQEKKRPHALKVCFLMLELFL